MGDTASVLLQAGSNADAGSTGGGGVASAASQAGASKASAGSTGCGGSATAGSVQGAGGAQFMAVKRSWGGSWLFQ